MSWILGGVVVSDTLFQLGILVVLNQRHTSCHWWAFSELDAWSLSFPLAVFFIVALVEGPMLHPCPIFDGSVLHMSHVLLTAG